MAKFNIDLSGRKGLAPQHQGHIDGSTPVPQYSYLGGEGQLADGTYNPFYRYGYMAPANDVFTALTGTISDRITSAVFDEVNDDLYLGTDGPNILRLDGLDDTSLTTDTTIDTDRDILDMEMYEVAGKRSLVYATDSSDIGDGMSLGFKGIDDDSGIIVFDLPVVTSNITSTYETIGNSDTNEILAQKILYGTEIDTRYKKCNRIRVRLSRLGAGTSYTIKVGIQQSGYSSQSYPSGTYLAYGTIDPSTISQVTDRDVNGQDVYVDLSTEVEFGPTTYFVVVEPTVLGEMTGTNSFVWYRTDSGNSIYSNGEACAYGSAAWSTADTTSESFDCSLILSETENLFPIKDIPLNIFTYISSLSHNSGIVMHEESLYWDSTHVISTWQGSGNDGYVQSFTVSSSGTITANGSALEFDITRLSGPKLVKIDSTHFLMAWSQNGSPALVQVFAVNSSTFAITAVGSPLTLTIPGGGAAYITALELVTSTKAVVMYTDAVSSDTTLQTLSIDGSYAVTALGSAVDLDTGYGELGPQSLKLLTGTYLAAAWTGTDSDGFTQIVSINTSTGAITLHGSALEIETDLTYSYSIEVIDSTHYVVVGNINTESQGFVAQCYAVDGSYNVTAVGSYGLIDRYNVNYFKLRKVKTGTYLVAYRATSNYQYLSTFDVDSSYNIVLTSSKIQLTENGFTTDSFSAEVMNENLVVVLTDNAGASGYIESYLLELTYDDDNFYVEEGQNSFICLSDNGLLYWFVGEKIHTIDGSLTGGLTGSITKEVLTFPSYLTTVDAVDTNGYMFIGIHSNLNASGSSDIRNFSTSPAGVYVWDRLSSLVRTRDYVPIHGVREIKRMFLSYSGDVMLFCINNAKQTELRRYSNGKFVIVQKLNKNGYPPYKHSIQYAGNMVVWQAQDGKMYAWGQTEFSDSEALFKIGDVGSHAATSFAPGIIHVSNDLASGTPQVSALVSWSDDTTQKLSRWHINGTGTINSVAQTGHIGNVHTLVYDMPAPIHINYAHLYGLPVANDGVGNTTVIATIKVYYNKNTTAEQTFSVTRKDMQDGYVYLPLNQKNIVSISFEIEYNTAQTLGSYDLYLQRMVVEYNPELQSKK